MKKSLSILFLILLLAKPDWAFTGAKNGLVLWGMVILPALLPFMICSQTVVGLGAVPLLMKPFQPVLSHVLHLSRQGGYVFLSGLLCGYPMGAKTCREFLENGLISKSEAQYLLAVCNHPSPMFILGYVMSQIASVTGLSTSIPPWKVLAALYLPVFPMALLAEQIYQKPAASVPEMGQIEPGSAFSFDSAFLSCAETMVKIGGYIMLFSIIALYTAKLPLNVPFLRGAILGTIEITTGIQAIAGSVSGIPAVLLIVTTAAFGGISGIFQTRSVLGTKKNAGLSIRHYVLWKLLHGILSLIILALFLIPY